MSSEYGLGKKLKSIFLTQLRSNVGEMDIENTFNLKEFK
jgi:hypothetical protein